MTDLSREELARLRELVEMEKTLGLARAERFLLLGMYNGRAVSRMWSTWHVQDAGRRIREGVQPHAEDHRRDGPSA